MKTMKIYAIAFVILNAFSIASCNSDDEVENPFTTDPVENAVFTEGPLQSARLLSAAVH